jgi:hypothetical protein
MALHTFGGTPGDVLVDAAGNVVPNWPILVKVAGTGQAITALYEVDGVTPIGELRSNASAHASPGAIRPFKADADAIEYEYLDGDGDPVRWYQAGRELATEAKAAADVALPTTGGTMTGKIQAGMATAGAVTEASFVTGDTFDRYRRDIAGGQTWGSGAAARDVTLTRTGPSEMTLTGSLVVTGSTSTAGMTVVKGAVGNGIADDRAVIQAALDSVRDAGGGIVLIPGGKTYGIGTFLVVYDNTMIWAYGATLKAIGNAGLLRNFRDDESFGGYAGHSNISILGGTWDGNAANAGIGTVTGTTNVMGFVHAANITVRDATIKNTSSAHAIEFNAVDGGTVERCRFLGFKDNSGGTRAFSEAVQIDMAKSGSASIGLFDNTPAKNITVERCYFGASDRLGPHGRAVGSHTAAANVTFDNVQVIANRIDGMGQEGVFGFGWRRAVVSKNIITGCGMSGISMAMYDPTSISTSPHTYAIHANTVESSASDSGIRVVGAPTYKIPGVAISGNVIRSITGNAIHAEHCAAPDISGNQADTTTSSGLYAHLSNGANISGNVMKNAGSNGLNVSGSVGAIVTGNVVEGTGSNHGIFVGPGTGAVNATDALISGNMVTAAASAGIRLSTAAARCTVTGNKVRKGSGTTVNGITLAADATGAVIASNDLSGNAWTAAVAIVASTAAPVLDWAGGTASPGHNRI